MNVLFASDNNYVRHLGVALYSLLDQNRDFDRIRIFVAARHIADENVAKLQAMVGAFGNATLELIDSDAWSGTLQLNFRKDWPISLSSYARLFVAEMLPRELERVLYLDSDVVVCGSLADLWNTELGGHCLAAVQDQVSPGVKCGVGLRPEDRYFNAGMLLIDLKRWREQECGQQCLRLVEAHHGQVVHHDQGVLNGVFGGQWTRLPLRFNVMTIHYMMSQPKVQKYFGDYTAFYSEQEVKEAVQSPAVLHFTPSFTSHPWQTHCKHPLRRRYAEALAKTPWRGTAIENDTDPWYLQLINWRYCHLPF